MKISRIFFVVALVFACQAACAQLDRVALTAFLQRVVKDKASRFDIAWIAPVNGKDVFELEQLPNRIVDNGRTLIPGKIVLRGSNGVGVASALNYYLKNYCHSLITWNGSSLYLPVVLPVVKEKVHKETPYTYRYYLNYCTFNYSMAWWDWDRWQREIDWMAMNGINMPLALTGEEAIWQEVYRSMGFTDAELDRFFSGPAYFSWLWMGNIDAWGGPLPAHWKEAHRLLQKKILGAERAFGMKPVLPAFTGHVPPSFRDRYPGARIKKTNWGAGFADVYILDPADPLFERIGKKFIEVQTREFGTDHLYSADTFNENVPPTTDSSYLDEMSKKVFASMALADPAAVWVMQGWMFHYNSAYWQPTQIQALLKAVPDDHMILLDLYSESHPVWNRTEAYYGKPWIWNMLHNFGGNISLWGRMQHAAEDPSKALHDPASGKMLGIGLTPEGIEQNPALYQLMLENVWQDGPVDVRDWLKRYERERYSDGGAREIAAAGDSAGAPVWALVDSAWALLEAGVYSGGLTEGGPESIIQARPTFEKAIDRVNTQLDYDPAGLVRAWGLFIRAAPLLKNSDGFRYDLVDITRQVLADYASPLQQQFAAAWRKKDTAAWRRTTREFLGLMDDMDRLLGTRRDFLLGKWIGEARSNGVDPAEKDLYEKNARDLITLWGDKESGLREYSCRQWSGLIRGFYKPRWKLLFRWLDRCLVTGREMDWGAFDKEVKDQEWKWVNSHDHYEDRTRGDAVGAAVELYRKYIHAVGKPGAFSGTDQSQTSNDHIFPAAAVARPFIDFDSSGFLVRGKRCFLVSAGIEYARVPHELWKDRLMRLKRAGFNCIEIYTFWNFHEPREGVFDFSGDHDLEAFLRLAGKMGLYAIVRVGPYYCAEWDNGGYPLWLRFKPGLKVREDNAVFEKYTDRFFDRLLPIVCRQQINHGGPVILVQLENEHTLGWGTAMPNGYFRHLRAKALSLGLEVPYFFSGLHHASDPAGEAGAGAAAGAADVGAAAAGEGVAGDPARLDDPSRPNPWLSTEFWSVWYSGYGSTGADSAVYDRHTWKIIAHGGNGYNYYMAHGGSNFAYTNNDEDAASYDYGAAVGQGGGLRPIYYAFKRAALFARSFADVLENSRDATAQWRGAITDTTVRITARHSPAGDILFLDNPSAGAVRVKWGEGPGAGAGGPGAGESAGLGARDFPLAPGEIFPIVHHFAIDDRVTLEWAPVKVLGITGKGLTRTIVIEGEPGGLAELHFIVRGPVEIIRGRGDLTVNGGEVGLRTSCPSTLAPMDYAFRVGRERVRILVMNRALADRTWFIEDGGHDYIACGAAYIGDVQVQGDRISLVTEEPGQGGQAGSVWVYGPGSGVIVLKREVAAGAAAANGRVVAAGGPGMTGVGVGATVRGQTPGGQTRLALAGWQQRRGDGPAMPGYDDSHWTLSGEPLQMGADGDGTADAWYRARIRADSDGQYTLKMEGGDRATIFVDGVPAAAGNIHEGEIPVILAKGPHVLAIATAQDGRDKLAGFLGDMAGVDSKGLTGKVLLEKGGPSGHELAGWHWLPAAAPLSAGQPVVLPSGSEGGWKPYTIGQDAFDKKQGFGWWRVVLPDPPAGVSKGLLEFRSVDENATVFLNGRQLQRHEGWNMPFRVSLDRLDTLSGPLVLMVFIENYSNEGGIDRPVRINYFTDAREIKGWRMRGGVGDPERIRDWAVLRDGSPGAAGVLSVAGTIGAPCYYRTEFRAPAYAGVGPHPVWRVHPEGLGHGSIWVNGHNLGRYPEKIPAPGLYIPECWMNAGLNELIVYEEDGRRPDRVTVEEEVAAGRWLAVYSNSGGTLLSGGTLRAQDILSYVDPMIGTAKSDVITRWGNEGGTYPGAVAPWGYMQVGPETRAAGGYDFSDSTIGWFSCVHHLSGYPNGSAGEMRIMPVREVMGGRPFIHGDEHAQPGYYRVVFGDDHTLVEATASERVGWWRVTYPAGVRPRLYIGGIGKIIRVSSGVLQGTALPAALHFSKAITGESATRDGAVLDFAPAAAGATVIVLAISVSPVGIPGAERNLQVEEQQGFDEVKKKTQDQWRKVLSVITVEDDKETDKKIFYTALYHSLLLPWIISDVEGNYKGSDGRNHKASGRNEYGGFSPWDSFRSLHPLLTLLFPDRQRDMILSMLDVYRQTGHLPSDPMTGNHTVPIIVDACLKGISGFDTALVWQAMKKGVVDTPYQQSDRAIYRQLGYIPFTDPESVTRTVEYAYDDWALSRFAGKLLHRDTDEAYLLRRSYNYRNLFDPAALFMLPREGDRFRLHPGNSGYKEGDAWVYTYFVPQHPKDLVNLLGGEQAFTERLDSALSRQDILFDNETVFHIPYLFDDAGRPGKTQEWVSTFRDGRFAATPGGLPGNDDLGAFSSWYVFSAMGFYPVCPGRAEYSIGTPLFRAVVLHLAGDRSFIIRAPGADGRNRYIRSVEVNHRPYDRLVLSHELIIKGGEILFDMSGVPADGWAKYDKGGRPAFSFSRIKVSKQRAAAHELLQVNFALHNAGNMGTKIVKLFVNGHEYARKNCLVMAGGTLVDSIGFRLYPFGKTELTIEGTGKMLAVEVRDGTASDLPPVEVTGLLAKSLLRMGEEQSIYFDAQNIGGSARRIIIPVLVDERVVLQDTLLLQPGEKKTVVAGWVPDRDGLQVIRVNEATEKFKVYSDPAGSLSLSLSLGKMGADGVVPDASGFGNRGMVKGGRTGFPVDAGTPTGSGGAGAVGAGKGLLRLGKDCYVEVNSAPSLDRMGETITMMAWVYPMARGGDLVDLFTKGDNHVLQVKENRSLSFFAGGWGRGDCTVDLPADWLLHWHSIAGVCTGEELLLYIDGELKGRSKVDGKVNLSVSNHWVLGRNEEFPGQRIFDGYMDRVMVWGEALSAETIKGMAKEPVPGLVLVATRLFFEG